VGWEGIVTRLGAGFGMGSGMGMKIKINVDGDRNTNYILRMEMSGSINHIFSHF